MLTFRQSRKKEEFPSRKSIKNKRCLCNSNRNIINSWKACTFKLEINNTHTHTTHIYIQYTVLQCFIYKHILELILFQEYNTFACAFYINYSFVNNNNVLSIREETTLTEYSLYNNIKIMIIRTIIIIITNILYNLNGNNNIQMCCVTICHWH